MTNGTLTRYLENPSMDASMTKVCVTGGRFYSDRAFLFQALSAYHHAYNITELAHGATPTGKGADWLADEWAKSIGLNPVRYPVNTVLDGPWPYAGCARNGRMLADFKPQVVIAFSGGRGTADCTFRAHSMNLPVWETWISYDPGPKA